VNFKEQRKKSIQRRLLGITIAAPAIISTVISLLRMLYFRLDNGTQIGGMIAEPFKKIVSAIHENTQFLSFFWENSPTPNHMNLPEVDNLYFLAIYLIIFIGFAFYTSGKKLAVRLSEINTKIENQLIEESIKGAAARSREEIELTTNIPSSSIFTQIHQLYLAPVITAIVAAALIALLNI